MNITKKLFKKNISRVLDESGTNEVLSEAALPAYAHKNPLIDFIFWERLKSAASYIDKQSGGAPCDILDFGCGTGLFSYHLANRGHRIMALDLDLTPVTLLKRKINYPETIHFTQGDFLSYDFGNRKFDFITALDVLEHIPLDVLPEYLHKFRMLLKEGGQLVVSGPSENSLYRLGRRIAGSDFTGEYHETTIAKIKAVFELQFHVQTLRRLIWPLTFFEVFSAKLR